MDSWANSAKDIYQQVVDTLSDALMQYDFAPFSRLVAFPHITQTLSTTIVMADQTKLRICFDSFVMALKAQSVTNHIRVVDFADFTSDDRIVGQHTSYILGGDHYIVQPYSSRLMLDRENGIWRVSRAVNAIINVTWPIFLPVMQDHPKLPAIGSISEGDHAEN
jgi:hypothetical protein